MAEIPMLGVFISGSHSILGLRENLGAKVSRLTNKRSKVTSIGLRLQNKTGEVIGHGLALTPSPCTIWSK